SVPQVWRKISRRSQPCDDGHSLPKPIFNPLPYRMPIIRVDSYPSFYLLGGARYSDHCCKKFPSFIPEKERIDIMIFRTFKVSEFWKIGVAIHSGSAIRIGNPAVITSYGIA